MDSKPASAAASEPGSARLHLLAATCRSLPLLSAATPFLILLLAVLAQGRPVPLLGVLLLLLLAAWQGLLAWRLWLDAALFRLLADGLEQPELDQWLARWLNRPLRLRTMAQREQGALRLMRCYRRVTLLVWAGTLLQLQALLLQAVVARGGLP